ncbi:MAG: BlaI/MecI/CopY family transcriptional regulator [Verrucomicrobiae bacterium]|nr:BlaI/MecI/CopY family transcriptional regulator [Verrucomicrobiae bacterium]MCP5540807.1 BlaI/MecI/CopY family transcriptional regulator [Akkermansiaceae bacterium]MCP5551288.1 BlaI/MecI/CopY family transcriptional regulator [Akkermansiaceae bacterium]
MSKPAPRPTETELSILRILWDHGPCRVREVVEELARERGGDVGYTTALKLLQLMHEKGLVIRDESERSHTYAARHPREKMQRQVVKSLADKLFGGATARLALHALSAEEASADDLAEIRRLLDRLESENPEPKEKET